jgi:RNase H-fold protein (predicted Holliday junction resolvase)
MASANRLLFAAIVPLGNLDAAIRCISSGQASHLLEWRTEGGECVEAVCGVFLGNGTSSEAYEKRLRDAGIGYKLTDERMTTLEAREIYQTLYPPKGLRRLIPRPLRLPPRPVDDLAAWVIIGRGLAER